VEPVLITDLVTVHGWMWPCVEVVGPCRVVDVSLYEMKAAEHGGLGI